MGTPLYDRDYPLIIRRKMAQAIGLNEAIVLQQLIYLLENPCNGRVLKDGHHYIYNTYEQWRDQYFPWWSAPTIKRIFLDLEERSLVISLQPDRGNRRKYYRVSEGALRHLTAERLKEAKEAGALETDHGIKMIPCPTDQIDPTNGSKRSVLYNTYTTSETTHTTSSTWDACVHELALLDNPKPTKRTLGRAAKALSIIREETPSVTAADIRTRVVNYATWFTVPVSSSALAKWWGRCEQPRGVGMIPAEPLPQISDEEREMWANGVKG